MPRKPTFICIGAQKTGTTWLHKLLKKHPDIWIPKRPKEIHFFNREILRKPLSWYEGLFEDPDNRTIAAGEKTPGYAHMKPYAIDFVRRYLPDIRLILILRRPDERAWSQARMEVSDYNKRELGPKDRIPCIFHLGLLRNSRLTRYDRMLERWRHAFPPERMLVLFNDDIDREPVEVLRRVAAFLGVSQACPDWTRQPDKTRVWKSPDLEMPPAIRWYLQRRYRPMSQQLVKEFGAPIEPWLKPDPQAMPVSFWDKLRVRFIADVATIPYNLAYLCYDFIRDLRMVVRLKGLVRELAGREAPAAAERAEQARAAK